MDVKRKGEEKRRRGWRGLGEKEDGGRRGMKGVLRGTLRFTSTDDVRHVHVSFEDIKKVLLRFYSHV